MILLLILKENGFEKILELYPVLKDTKVQDGKITTNRPKNKVRVKLNKENWNKMRDLWKTFSNRYMLSFERISEENMQLLVDEVMKNQENFVLQYPESSRNEIYYHDESGLMQVRELTARYEGRKALDGMVYGEFLSKLSKQTRVQIKQLHRSLSSVLKNIYRSNTKFLNEITLANLSRDFKKRFDERYSQSYTYQDLDFQASTSVFDEQKDDFKDDILAEVIGVNNADNVIVDNRQLYEVPPLRFDSIHPEKDLLTFGYDSSVTVFGKLPKRAIQVPKYTGGTTTPDFIYVVERKDEKNVYLLVETKAENMRLGDQQIVEIHKKFFSVLENHDIEYREAMNANDVYSKLEEIVRKND